MKNEVKIDRSELNRHRRAITNAAMQAASYVDILDKTINTAIVADDYAYAKLIRTHVQAGNKFTDNIHWLSNGMNDWTDALRANEHTDIHHFELERCIDTVQAIQDICKREMIDYEVYMDDDAINMEVKRSNSYKQTMFLQVDKETAEITLIINSDRYDESTLYKGNECEMSFITLEASEVRKMILLYTGRL